MVKVFVVIFLNILCLFTEIYATVLKVVQNNSMGIQQVVDKALLGDTVIIPEGKYYLERAINVRSGIYIKGENYKSTILLHTSKSSKDGWAIIIDGSNRRMFRISGLSIIGLSPDVSSGILVKDNSNFFRIDHCYFEKCSRRAIEIHGISRGLIDHSVFKRNWYTSIVIFGNGISDWLSPLKLGDSNSVYVEDNYFEQDSVPEISMAHHIASNNGSRYVFRHNVIKDGKIASHAIDAHGNKFGSERGSRSVEIYNNTLFAVHRWAGINIRGGDGVIFGNVFTGDYISPIHLMHEGREGDGNCKYPCIDQIRSLYIWNNSYNGKDVEVYVRYPEIIQKNRDYFLFKKKDYIPYTYPHPAIKRDLW